MEVRKLQDQNPAPSVVAFRDLAGRVVGFHPEKLEVADLSDETWQGLSSSHHQVPNEALAELIEWSRSLPEEFLDEGTTPYISSVNINVTQICNLKCVYCEAGGDGTYGRPEKRIQIDKALPHLSKLLDRVPNQGTFTVTFVGGEPLMYPDGMKMVGEHVAELAKGRGIRAQFRVVTNGTLFTEKALGILKVMRAEIVVSMDGPPEHQDRIRPTRGGTGSSGMLIAGLKALKYNRESLEHITLRAIFGPHQIDIRETYHFMTAFDFDSIELNFDVTCSDPEISRAYTKNMQELAREIFAQGGEARLRKIRLFDHVFERLDSKLRVKNFCDSGKSFVAMDSSGKLFKCPWEVNDDSLKAGSEVSPESLKNLQVIERTLIEHNNCGQCWAKHLCGGGCMYAHGLATGVKSRPDPIYCERTRALISEAIMIYTLSREVSDEEAC